MDKRVVTQICSSFFSREPDEVKRCAIGIGNHVFMVKIADVKYIVRCSSEENAYRHSIHWLRKLIELEIPVPKVIAHGSLAGFCYLILEYLEGQDLGLVYLQLTEKEKRNIAREIVRIQNNVATLDLEGIPSDWVWRDFVREMLSRAEKRIAANGYFSTDKVEWLRKEATRLEGYFSEIKPAAYLDDISSKNLLIHDGHISGIIDVDWIGIGDKLTYVALTHMALLNLEYPTDYVTYLLEEMKLDDLQMRAFCFYTLLYCVDFMGERGMTFLDKTIEVNPMVITRLNCIFEMLKEQWETLWDVS